MSNDNLLESIASLFWPTQCAGCGNRIPGEQGHLQFPGFCPGCASTLSLIQDPICRCCGIPFSGAGSHHTCLPCSLAPPPFSRARTALEYGGAIAQAIQRFKYGKVHSVRRFLTRFLVDTLSELSPPDLIVPIPLHPRRLRQRGFNQSALLAKALARQSSLPWDPGCLVRIRDTHTQAGLTRIDRRKNMAGAFRAARRRRLLNKSVLVVDDVITTTTTVREAASVLARAGARQVEIIALARSVDSHY